MLSFPPPAAHASSPYYLHHNYGTSPWYHSKVFQGCKEKWLEKIKGVIGNLKQGQTKLFCYWGITKDYLSWNTYLQGRCHILCQLFEIMLQH